MNVLIRPQVYINLSLMKLFLIKHPTPIISGTHEHSDHFLVTVSFVEFYSTKVSAYHTNWHCGSGMISLCLFVVSNLSLHFCSDGLMVTEVIEIGMKTFNLHSIKKPERYVRKSDLKKLKSTRLLIISPLKSNTCQNHSRIQNRLQ